MSEIIANSHPTDGIVELRPLTVDDAAAHLAGEDAEQIRWLSGTPATSADTRAWIDMAGASWRAGGPQFVFGICLVEGHHLIGVVDANLKCAGREPDEVNIAYTLYAQARGQGYATRAVLLAIEFLRRCGLAVGRRAVIVADPMNKRSMRVAERAGFRLVGEVEDERGLRRVKYEMNP